MLVWGRCGYPRVTLVTARGAASAHGESPGRAGALGSVLMACTGACGAPNTALSPEGEPLPPHQDPGGLLLLRVRPHPAQGRPRALLRGDGPGHDRHHHVSVRRPRPRGPQAPPPRPAGPAPEARRPRLSRRITCVVAADSQPAPPGAGGRKGPGPGASVTSAVALGWDCVSSSAVIQVLPAVARCSSRIQGGHLP